MTGHILKISLENTHPPVWRRIMIPEGMNFQELHDVIQIVFEWTDDHLHSFDLPDRHRITMRMEELDFYRDPEDVREDKASVDNYYEDSGGVYGYGFGDGEYEDNRFPLDEEEVNEKLKQIIV